MASFSSSITAYFGGDTTGLGKAIDKAQGMVGAFVQSLGKIGIGLGAAAVVGFFKEVSDKVGELADLSDELGVSSDALQAFQYAAEKAGAKVQNVALMFRTARNQLDSLAEGNEKATETFAKLNLTQQDLIGLPLEAALEKIAKAYKANEGSAGAYGAIIDIVGSRSAKLMGVLQELGDVGFKGLEDKAKSAGQLIGTETMAHVDAFGDRLTDLKNMLIAGGAEILAFGQKVVTGWGYMAAAVVNFFDGIDTEVPVEKAKKVEAAVKKVSDAVKGQAATIKDIYAFNEGEQKRQLAALEQEGKFRERQIALLDIAQGYLSEAAKYGEKTKEHLELVGKAKEKMAEFDKNALADQKARQLEYEKEKEYVDAIIRSKNGMSEADKKIIDEHKLLLRQKYLEKELQGLLAEGYDNLTLKEQERVGFLDKVLKKIAEQIAALTKVVDLTGSGVDALGNYHEELFAATAGTQTLASAWGQVAAQMKAAGLALVAFNGIQTAKSFGKESTEVLREKIRRNMDELSKLQFDATQHPGTNANYFNRQEKARLEIENQNLQKEIDLRSSITSIVEKKGLKAGMQAFPGDPEFFADFLSVAQGQAQTGKQAADDLSSIKSLLVNVFKR